MAYDPKKALRRVTRSMDSVTRKQVLPSERPLTLETNREPVPCAVLLRSLIENGPVPDDFAALPKTATAFKARVRPDGAVYKGAFEQQGDRTSVVLVWGPRAMTLTRAEQIATIERSTLIARHDAKALGPFARRPFVPPAVPSPVTSPTNAETA